MKFNTIPTFFLLLLLASINTLNAQEKLKGNKVVITEDRDISNFNAIEVKGKIDVILVQGNDQSVVVETDENLQFAIITEVTNDNLIIKLSKKIIKKKALNVYITIDEFINTITTKDNTKITVDGILNFNTLTINAEGNSKITMDLKSEQFILNNNESANVSFTVNTEHVAIHTNKTAKTKINLSSNTTELLTLGNSTTELIGDSAEFTITSENKSTIKASKLECNDIIVNASDASDVYINSKDSITISAINSAEIYIYNNPKITIEKFTDKAILRKK